MFMAYGGYDYHNISIVTALMNKHYSLGDLFEYLVEMPQ